MNRPPRKGKGLTGMTREAFSIQTQPDSETDRSEIIDANTEARKRSEAIARCRRQLASAGAQLVELPAGSFLVVCGGFSRHCQEFGDVQALLRNARAGS